MKFKPFSNYPLQKKILVMVSFLVFLPYLALTFFISSYYQNREVEKNNEQYTAMLHTAELMVGRSLAQVESVMSAMVNQSTIRATLKTTDWNDAALSLMFDAQSELNRNRSYLKAYGAEIMLISPNSDLFDRYGDFYRQFYYQDDAEFAAFSESSSLLTWTLPHSFEGGIPLYTSGSEPVISCWYKVNDTPFKTIGAALCSVKISSIFSPLYGLSEYGTVRIEKDGALVCCIAEGRLIEAEQAQAAEKVLRFDSQSSSIPYQISLEVPAAYTATTGYYLLAVLLPALLYVLLMTLIISIINILLKKVNLLSRLMRVIDLNEEDQRIPDLGADEIGRLGKSINRLLEKVEEQRREILEEERHKRMAQRYALRFQMNPHLLFNSLHWLQLHLAPQDGEAQQGIALLGEMYRYNLTDNSSAAVQEEIKNAEVYTTMMQLMKKEEIFLSVRCPEEIYEQNIPRFTLQPLIENAIKHGSRKDAPIHIAVTFSVRGKELFVCVENDGLPIGAEKLEEINESLLTDDARPAEKHIGLANLAKRLRLSYNGSSSIQISTAEGRTAVTIRIPWRRDEA